MDNHHNRVDAININGVEYKLCKIIDKTATDIHHIMWKCNKAKYNTNIDENKVRINRRLHVALNAFFGDKQNPREQLKQVFEIVKPVLSLWVKQELETILYQTDDDLFYIPELIKWKKKKKQKTNTNINI